MENYKDILRSEVNHNKYCKWYYGIIDRALSENRSKSSTIYYELHHILPKNKNAFPEFRNLKKFPWNGVLLTGREHFVAHLCLTKMFLNETRQRSMVHAIMLMRNYEHLNSSLYEALRASIKMSEETRAKIAQSHKGKSAYWNIGKKRSPEHIAKMKEGAVKWSTGRIVSEETKQKIRASHQGKRLTVDHKNKISEKLRGHTQTDYQKRKAREANLGKIVSLETRQKIKESNARTRLRKSQSLSESSSSPE